MARSLLHDNGRLSVTFLDVGQGEATLIEAPGGQRVLIDGGPSAEAIDAALGRNLPFYDRRIDLVVLTHPQADHLAGLISVVDTYDVGAVLATSASQDTGVYQAWRRALADAAIPTLESARGQTIDLGEDAEINVLSPPPHFTSTDSNEGSLVLRLRIGDVAYLLTADATVNTERALIQAHQDVAAQVLKVGHHGSDTSTSPAFLKAVNPEIDVISVGAGNSFGHPTEAVLDRLTGDHVLRTDLNGDITITTDGHELWVETQRDGN